MESTEDKSMIPLSMSYDVQAIEALLKQIAKQSHELEVALWSKPSVFGDGFAAQKRDLAREISGSICNLKYSVSHLINKLANFRALEQLEEPDVEERKRQEIKEQYTDAIQRATR